MTTTLNKNIDTKLATIYMLTNTNIITVSGVSLC